MQWPVSRKVYKNADFLAWTQQTIATIANQIVQHEPVILLAAKHRHAEIRKQVSGQVELWGIATDDLWARDAGPLVAKLGTARRVVSMNFNGWGGKQTHRYDGAIARQVAQMLDFPVHNSGVIGEPGGVDHDGAGLLIAHESSWVKSNRSAFSRDRVEDRLLDAYGADRMIWAPGLRGKDITDDHIDSLARFTGPGRIVVQLDDTVTDQWSAAHHHSAEIFASSGLKVEILPAPRSPRVDHPEFAGSYANFYVCNGAVFVSALGDPETDAIAQDILAQHYPGRAIRALNTDALGWLGGGVHCATQQLPIV